MDGYTGSSSVWDVLPTITGQFFDWRTAQAAAPAPPAPAAVLPPAVTTGLNQLLPLLLIGAVAFFAIRALK